MKDNTVAGGIFQMTSPIAILHHFSNARFLLSSQEGGYYNTRGHQRKDGGGRRSHVYAPVVWPDKHCPHVGTQVKDSWASFGFLPLICK